MPDTELFQLAKEDQLQEDEKLVEQVRRMLHSPIDKRWIMTRSKGSGIRDELYRAVARHACFGSRIPTC